MTDKQLFDEIKQKLINFEFPLQINKTNIIRIENILKINICILTADEKENIYPMFSSENDHKNVLSFFYYKDHICLIKDINKYLHRNNKDNNKKYFCVRCLNSFISEENLNKHIDLCYCIDVQGNTTISTSTSNFGSSGRVDGPLLETRSLLTCHQPRGSQALSTQRCYPPTTARPKVYL